MCLRLKHCFLLCVSLNRAIRQSVKGLHSLTFIFIFRDNKKLLKTLGAMGGGVVEACCLQPLDVLKTRLQVSMKL